MTMVTDKIRILMIDDDEDDFFLVSSLLDDISPEQYIIQWASTYEKGVLAIESRSHDLYLVDYRLGQYTGIDMLHYFQQQGYNDPVILLTGKGDYKIDKEAMEAGASDYLVKGEITAAMLERAIRYTLDKFSHLTAIANSERRYFSIFEKSNDIILLANCDKKIIAANPAALRVLQHDAESLYEHDLMYLFALDEQIKDFLSQLCDESGVVQQEYVFRNKAGQKLDVVVNATLLDEKKQIFLCIVQDITEQKKKAKEKQQQEKFVITGRIARLIAHEVRNPLTNILLSISQLKEEKLDDIPDSELYLDIMERNCHRINQLVTQLLESTRMMELHISAHGVNELVKKAMTLAADRLQLNNMRLEASYMEPDVMLQADEEKMIIALLNIIINGIEAMQPDKGVLTIRTFLQDNKAIIHIGDNGSGISEENKSKLFEPFFTNKTKGTGLGLTSTQNIILNHKGSIEVESVVGNGTVFTITFDVSQ